MKLSQTQFGLWCAIAIHDSSSVVGAASKYGTQALEIATTVNWPGHHGLYQWLFYLLLFLKTKV